MLAAIGLSLPIALGLLFVSMPMAVIVLVMITAGAHRGAASFLLGWVLGISAVVAVTIVIADYSFAESESESAQSSVWSSVVRIVLGLVLFGLAFKQWRARPKDGSDPTVPKWMKSIDGLTPRKAFGLAFLSAAVNPKNAALAVSGAATIAVATNVVAQQIVAAVIFTIIASVGIASPILVKVFSGKRADDILVSAKAWMTANNAVMMAVILAILGATVLGEGLSGLQ
ncbi:GAP family protein [Rhodococcus baikonurensis]|uniref:GAP family protein n=1 Tax=Rhodococcus TaxID=1827 RepID=UPI001A2D2052|nr:MULTISPECIES: GAP family protein [Rhodococcus]MBJ7476400.1 GAP family protein [Rhodococcus sp. (in: high G+C Gram-positive bacteria)]UJC80679.1 GAP family protein [Rhodococcus erythropolis]